MDFKIGDIVVAKVSHLDEPRYAYVTAGQVYTITGVESRPSQIFISLHTDPKEKSGRWKVEDFIFAHLTKLEKLIYGVPD